MTNLDIRPGEQVALVGDNDSGKSRLAAAFAGSRNAKYITFRDSYGSYGDRNFFMQQRWNLFTLDWDPPTVDGRPLVTFSSGELRKYQLARALEEEQRALEEALNPTATEDVATDKKDKTNAEEDIQLEVQTDRYDRPLRPVKILRIRPNDMMNRRALEEELRALEEGIDLDDTEEQTIPDVTEEEPIVVQETIDSSVFRGRKLKHREKK